MKNKDITIFIVDDEPVVCQAIALTLKSEKFTVRCFNNPQECIDILAGEECDLLITDINMPGLNGVELLSKARYISPLLPLIAITGYASVQLTVSAIKAGAIDFIEKPLERETLLAQVKTALEESARQKLRRENNLTKTEFRILDLIMAGKCNKEIARKLCRSTRTVEDHRLNVMRKLHASNIVGLVQKVLSYDSHPCRPARFLGNQPENPVFSSQQPLI